MLPDHETIPEVSIVMPLYNKGGDVVRAVSSVLAQSRSDFELIIVNDGSTDNGPDLVRTIQDSRIRIIDQANKGVSAARNRGISEARADLVAFLDADDEWYPDFLDTIFSLMIRFPGCSVFATNYIYLEKNGRIRSPVINGLPAKRWQGVLNNYFRIAAQSDPPLWTSAVVVKREALLSVGCFPVGVTSGEDLLTWAKLAWRYNIAFSNSVGAVYYYSKSIKNPPRLPDIEDKVGEELRLLLSSLDSDKEQSLKHYIALWHKMRAVQYLRNKQNNLSRCDICKSLYYMPDNRIFLIYKYLTYMPTNLLSFFFYVLNLLRKARRV